MKICPGCGTSNKDENIFCIGCSKIIEETVLFCIHCGNKIVSTNKFCKFCGNEIGKSTAAFSQGNAGISQNNTDVSQSNSVISQGNAGISQGNVQQKDTYVKAQTPVITQSYGKAQTPGITHTSEKAQTSEVTQTYGNNQTYNSAQIPPRKKQPYKKLIIALSIILPVFFISLALALVFTINIIPATSSVNKPYVNRFTTDYSFSKDQKTVINRWGHPDGFLLAIEPETNERFESWFYYVMGSEMIFLNGEFMEGSDLTIYDVTGTKDEFTVYPYEFTNKARRDDIIAVLGEPTKEDNYQDGELTIMYYQKELVITLLDGRVAGITFSHAVPDAIK